MKFTLKAGSELDLLTEQELRSALAEFGRLFEQDARERVRTVEQALTDANGDAAVSVYGVPAGMRFVLNRVLAELDGSDPDTPYTTGGYVGIFRGDHLIDFFAVKSIPGSWAEGHSSAPLYLNHEDVVVKMVGGPANTRFRVSIEGDLFPMSRSPQRA